MKYQCLGWQKNVFFNKEMMNAKGVVALLVRTGEIKRYQENVVAIMIIIRKSNMKDTCMIILVWCMIYSKNKDV